MLDAMLSLGCGLRSLEKVDVPHYLTGWRDERERPSLYVEDMTTRVLNGTLRERGQCRRRHASDKFVKQ